MKNQLHEVYEQTGKLFYAIAAEQQVKPLEIAALKFVIEKNCEHSHPGRPGGAPSEMLHIVLLTMDELQGATIPPREAFNDFSEFYLTNQNKYTPDMKEQIVNTARDIVEIFMPDHPGENIFFSTLMELFSVETVKN